MRALKLLLVPAALLALATTSACSIWFLIHQDPAGLPCADEPPFCLATYTCVEGVCQKAAQGDPGTACVEDAECQEGLVCTNVWEEETCGEDISCELGRGFADGDRRRCHPSCNPAVDPKEQCAPGERCWPDAEGTGWCQSGVCEAPSQCGQNPRNGLTNICYGAGIHPGGRGSGLCTSACDPLECNPVSGCPDCPLYDIDGDGEQDVMGCEPYEQVLTSMGCIPAGSVPHGGTCDGVTTFCQAGSFCLQENGQAAGYCARICRVGGGNPACDFDFPTCSPIGNTGFGFCS